MRYRILLLKCFFCVLISVAQSTNSQLHIRYAPAHGYNPEAVSKSLPLQLQTLDSYLHFRPVEGTIDTNISMHENIRDYTIHFQRPTPAVYYLTTKNDNKLIGQMPERMLWLGKGSILMEIYDLGGENEHITIVKNEYRAYYEGQYAKENSFLEKYMQAAHWHQNLALMRVINLPIATHDELLPLLEEDFSGVDSTVQALRSLYALWFPKPEPAFDKVVKQELLYMPYQFKLMYILYTSLSGGNTFVPAILRQEMEEIQKEVLQKPTMLESESYRMLCLLMLTAHLHTNRLLIDTNGRTETEVNQAVLQQLQELYQTNPTLLEYMHAFFVYTSAQMHRRSENLPHLLSDFATNYPRSTYTSLLQEVVQIAEQKQDTDEIPMDIDTVVTEYSSTLVQDIKDLDSAEKHTVRFWNDTLYTAEGKPVTLADFRGKPFVIHHLYNVQNAGMAYCSYIEKHSKGMSFVYIVFRVPSLEDQKIIHKFGVKGKVLYIYPPEPEQSGSTFSGDAPLPPPPPINDDVDLSTVVEPPIEIESTWHRYLIDENWYLIGKEGTYIPVDSSAPVEEIIKAWKARK